MYVLDHNSALTAQRLQIHFDAKSVCRTYDGGPTPECQEFGKFGAQLPHSRPFGSWQTEPERLVHTARESGTLLAYLASNHGCPTDAGPVERGSPECARDWSLRVETHRMNLMQKLNLHSTAEIVLYAAVRKRIISSDVTPGQGA
jgi:hypothetical protein